MILTCTRCGQKNRVPAKHLSSHVRCASCKRDLAPVAEPIEANADVFDEVVREASVPVLVDFWAEWCGPCRMAAPEVKKVAQSMAGRAIVMKVDTDRYPEIASRYGVRGIPNFVVFRDGRTVVQQAGVVPQATMEGWLEQAGA